MCSILPAAITSVSLLVEGKLNFARSSLLFFESFFKVMIAGPSSIHRLAWYTMTNSMDCSAVKM